MTYCHTLYLFTMFFDDFFNDEMYMFASPFFELWLLFYIMWTRIGILGVFPCKPQ